MLRANGGGLGLPIPTTHAPSSPPPSRASGGKLVGFSPRTWGLLLGSVLGPQLVGHQGLDWALRWLPAPTISAITLLEPVGASVLAAVCLGEWPTPAAAFGGLVTLLGVCVATA